MSDFYEVDFLNVESRKSGDAITVRRSFDGVEKIYVTDGGYQNTGDVLVEHINKHYSNPKHLDAVVVTHQDGDHAGGLRKLFGTFNIGEIWMLRPWEYADQVIDRFSKFTNVDRLKDRLKELYKNIFELEKLAVEYGVPIKEPFQGARIGDFTVMAPTKGRYLDLLVESERTPAESKDSRSVVEGMEALARRGVEFFRSAWGDEYFPPGDTSAENNMSVVQYAELCGNKVLLTGDAGRAALEEAAEYAPLIGLELPGIHNFQVPHHGGRRNVNAEILNKWLGEKQEEEPEKGKHKFLAVVSASEEDEDHPRNSVVRALIHRGAKVISTERNGKRVGHNVPERESWTTAEPLSYPKEQEK